MSKFARTTNFTTQDKSLLLDLVQKYSEIVENKMTDACTSKVSKVDQLDAKSSPLWLFTGFFKHYIGPIGPEFIVRHDNQIRRHI